MGPSAKDSFCGEYRQKQCSDSAGANEKALYEQGVKLGLALEVRKWSGSTGGRLKIELIMRYLCEAQKDEQSAEEP